MIRYERLRVDELLGRVRLEQTAQERQLTRILHVCAEKMAYSPDAKLRIVFVEECARLPEIGVMSRDDREAFEDILDDLGKMGMEEQTRVLDSADKQLARREEMLVQEAAQKARLIRTLGLTSGAAAFLLLI